MSQLFDTSAINDDPARWDERAEQVAALAARRATRAGVTRIVQSRAGWVTVCALFVTALAAAALASGVSPARFGAEWDRALAPADEMGQAIILREGPPAIGMLMLRTQRTE